MIDIVMTLVFSVVMLLFMIYPAMVIVAWIERRIQVNPKWRNPLLFGIILLLSIMIGVFLRFA